MMVLVTFCLTISFIYSIYSILIQLKYVFCKNQLLPVTSFATQPVRWGGRVRLLKTFFKKKQGTKKIRYLPHWKWSYFHLFSFVDHPLPWLPLLSWFCNHDWVQMAKFPFHAGISALQGNEIENVIHHLYSPSMTKLRHKDMMSGLTDARTPLWLKQRDTTHQLTCVIWIFQYIQKQGHCHRFFPEIIGFSQTLKGCHCVARQTEHVVYPQAAQTWNCAGVCLCADWQTRTHIVRVTHWTLDFLPHWHTKWVSYVKLNAVNNTKSSKLFDFLCCSSLSHWLNYSWLLCLLFPSLNKNEDKIFGIQVLLAVLSCFIYSCTLLQADIIK